MTNILLTGIATVSVALVPGYARIGIAAPYSWWYSEWCKAWESRWRQFADGGVKRQAKVHYLINRETNIGMPLVGGSFTSCAMLLFPQNVHTGTGWRISMMLSALVVIQALLARYKLAESPLFDKLNRAKSKAECRACGVFQAVAPQVFLLALITAFQHMDSYVSGTYIIAFMRIASLR